VSQDRLGQPVDLDDDQPGLVADDAVRPVARQTGNQLSVERLIAADVEDGRQQRVEKREYERTEERGQHVGDLEAGQQPLHEVEDQHLEDEGSDDQCDRRDTREQGQQHRPHQRVDQGDQDDRQHQRGQRVDLEAGHDRGSQEQGHRADDQRHNRALDERPAARLPLPEHLDLQPVERDQAIDRSHRRPPVNSARRRRRGWGPR
jgi:hypothetical protein